MSNSEEKNPEKSSETAKPPPTDVEAQTASTRGVQSIVTQWKRQDLLKKGALISRGLALLFSSLAFIIMASNQHGDWKNFNNYEEYRYLLAIGIISTVYTLAQILRQVYQFSSGKELLSLRASNLLDFIGDQIVAYLLLSAASSAIPLTNRMREGSDNIFTDSTAASISMAFLAFLALGISAMVSGFKLSNQTYI